MNKDRSIQSKLPDDPVYLNAKREAIAVFLAFLIAGIYTALYSYFYGYDLNPATLETVCGVPSWVVWGVIAPWGAAIGFSFWFGLRFVSDDDLGREPEEESRD